MIDYNAVSDAELYGMCLAGEEGAWRYLYNYILTVCRWKKWGLPDYEEMAQQITLHVIEKAIKKAREKDKFRIFIKKTAVNKIKDSFKIRLLRGAPSERFTVDKNGKELIWEMRDPKPTQEKVLMDLEVVSVIDTAVRKLPRPCQRVVQEYLKYKMGLYEDYRELSKVLKMRVPTVSTKVRRCIDKLLSFKEIKELDPYGYLEKNPPPLG
jgi:RNA polymerase sigma factor (sigma-70 family)